MKKTINFKDGSHYEGAITHVQDFEFDWNRLSTPTAWLLSGLVCNLAYFRLLTVVAYGICLISFSSSSV